MPAAAREAGGPEPRINQAGDRLAARARWPLRRATRSPARDALLARSLDEAVAELTKRFGADMQSWKYGQERYHHALHPPPADGRRQRRDAREAERRPAAARRRRHDDQRHRQRRQPDLRRLVQDHRRHRGLGQLGRHQHAGTVGQPRQPALSRSVRAVGAGQLLHRRLLAQEGGVGDGERHAARTGARRARRAVMRHGDTRSRDITMSDLRIPRQLSKRALRDLRDLQCFRRSSVLRPSRRIARAGSST